MASTRGSGDKESRSLGNGHIAWEERKKTVAMTTEERAAMEGVWSCFSCSGGRVRSEGV